MSANLTRLKKRIETLEQWVDDNEALAGPEGTLDTMNYLIGENRRAGQMQAHLNQLQQYLQEYLNETESMDQWNEFIQTREKENNAIQEQPTEEVSVQEEAESSEEAVEASEEEE
tara:strand:+ start:435 stop:779 length:345 start_codon:yes stop_codon:yes gene_type:complete